MRKLFMLLTALVFTFGVASAQTPTACNKPKIESDKLERAATIKAREALPKTDLAKKKELSKKVKELSKAIKAETKICMSEHKAANRALKAAAKK